MNLIFLLIKLRKKQMYWQRLFNFLSKLNSNVILNL